MKKTIYNKLVRDKIPEIIDSSGKTCTTEVLDDEEYIRFLDAKLDEELTEYHKDQNIEELADLLEVIRAAAIGALVAPIGENWWEYKKSHPTLELYAEDGGHASPAGSDFAAKYIWETIREHWNRALSGH
jgi:predicted house-cleaning noncanonical NTP pyrophosphatase (MazG superfamily)